MMMFYLYYEVLVSTPLAASLQVASTNRGEREDVGAGEEGRCGRQEGERGRASKQMQRREMR